MGSLGSQEGNQEGTDGGMSPPETVATNKAREELGGMALLRISVLCCCRTLHWRPGEALSHLQRTSEPAL